MADTFGTLAHRRFLRWYFCVNRARQNTAEKVGVDEMQCHRMHPLAQRSSLACIPALLLARLLSGLAYLKSLTRSDLIGVVEGVAKKIGANVIDVLID